MANEMTDLSEVRSIRTAGDSWDITESVGATAFNEDRADAGQWLIDHGWHVEAVPSDQEMSRLGRPVPDDMTEMTFSSVLLRARLEGSTL